MNKIKKFFQDMHDFLSQPVSGYVTLMWIWSPIIGGIIGGFLVGRLFYE